MKRLCAFFLLTLYLSSCATKIIPIKGSYPSQPIIVTSDKSVSEVWDRLIDLFAQNGLSIKLIDKSSGLIISDNSAITATWEKKDMTLYHPDAYIVTSKYFNGKAYAEVGITQLASNKADLKNPSVCRGEWNVRIKPAGSGSSINVNLVNVKYQAVNLSLRGTEWVNLTNFRSTGNFEKKIADMIK